MTKTKVVHCKKKPHDVYIGRPSKWGNPFSHQEGTLAEFRAATREEAIEKYREWIMTQPELLADLHELQGKTLGCWCKPKKCHGDILAELADRLTPRKVSREEAIQIATANHERVEKLMAKEVERDARGTAVWEEGEDMERFYLGQDCSSHWYLVPAEHRKEFEAWQDLDEDDPAAWEVPPWAKRLNRHLSWVTFTDPKEE